MGRKLLIIYLFAFIGCYSGVYDDKKVLEDKDLERSYSYPTIGSHDPICSQVPVMINLEDGGVIWSSRPIPCDTSRSNNPVSDPPWNDEGEPEPPPGYGPRPDPPGDPVPWGQK